MNTLITIGLSIIAILALKYAFEKWNKISPQLVIKILAVSFCLMGVVRYFLSDSFVETVGPLDDPLQSFMRWGYHIGYAVLPMSVFFESRLFRNIASYFSLPVSIIAALLYDDTFAYFTAEGAGGEYINVHVRHVLYTLELIFAIIIPVLMKLTYKHKISMKTPREILMLLGITPLIMMQMMPSYIPKTLFDQEKLGFSGEMFGNLHILWICCLIVEIVVLHFVFRKRSQKDKFTFISFMVIAQVMHTMSPFLRGFTFSRLPLQLCNIAAFFYLYTIITKSKKTFDFGYVANLVGAAIAITLFTFGDSSITFWPLHYIYEHSFVVMVPVLCATLGIFPRLDKMAFKNMMRIFVVYFAFVFVFGTIINAIDTNEGYAVNHFYMFNPEVAVDYIPFAGFTGLVHWQFGEFEIYPILVVTVFVLFTALNFAFIGITLLSYKIIDKIKGKNKKSPEMATV